LTPCPTSRERLIRALNNQPNDRPPVWLMRQAGRCLPEYRALKTRYTFHQLISTPELATEVTLQPIRRFHFDAAILFSDILVIPEAMGVPFQFKDEGGLQMQTLKDMASVAQLRVDGIRERLDPVARALTLIRRELNGQTGLLGFAGSAWTLANFMLEGGGVANYSKALDLFRHDRTSFDLLCSRITEATAEYLRMQAGCGVDAIQIFDSLGGLIPEADFDAASGRWTRQLIDSLQGLVPVIHFSKGCRNWKAQVQTGARMLGIDHNINMAEAARHVPATIGLQGNLNPGLLSGATPAMVQTQTQALLETMRGRDGYIFNLGHGVPPDAKLENLETLTATVQHFS
jgi:uroporphyrinogen decarboxylase